MFDFLKKKIKDFVGVIGRKEEKAAEEQKNEAQPLTKEAEAPKETPTPLETTEIEQTQTPSEIVEKIEDQMPTAEPQVESFEQKAAENIIEEIEEQTPIQLGGEEKIEGKIVEKEIEIAKIEPQIEKAQEKTSEEKMISEAVKLPPQPPIDIAKEKREQEEKLLQEKQKALEAEKMRLDSQKRLEDQKAHAEKLKRLEEEKVRLVKEKQKHMLDERARLENERQKTLEIERMRQEEQKITSIQSMQPLEETDEEEKEIEELVGGTIEGEIKKDAIEAEKKIYEDKNKEEVARKVFGTQKEDFLAQGKERDLKPRVGFFSKIKGFITGEVEIKESDTSELFDQFEMALLESDVSFATAQALIADLKKRLVGRKVKTGKIQEEVRKEIAFALASVLQTSKSNFYEKVREAKNSNNLPFIVLFLGPNGMGKTTTIAKIAYSLKKNGFSSVISASDTFRAAAIEQAIHHGEKLGIKVVKHQYGSDPAAVAYDAIAHAKSHSLDVVLIDTAGRQDTNLNLLSEMQKIVRIVKPNIKIFIAEAIAGTSLVNQVKVFNEKLGVDGIVLTKLDCDAKGGGTLSIAYECKLPVYFVGTGQEYEDLLEFNEEWIVKNIMAE